MRHLDAAARLLALALALAGGAVLIALVILTCASIAGRAGIPLGLSPIPGDFELVELGTGIAVFAFLPWAVHARAHARVDLLAPLYGRRGNALLDRLSDLGMLAAALLIAWRLWAGLLDKLRYGETTFILQIPLWLAYGAAWIGAAAFVLVAAHAVLRQRA